jgi:serine palmitoyltransferase
MAFESEEVDQIPFIVYLYTTFAYATMILFGYINEYLRITFSSQADPKGYAPLFNDYSSFFNRHMFARVSDCWNRPINSRPGAWFDVVERSGCSYLDTLEVTEKSQNCLNLGSYNYLGFSENSTICIEEDVKTVYNFSSSLCSSRQGFGTSTLHTELEKTVAKYLDKDDAVIFGMGFATNSTSIPALIGKVHIHNPSFTFHFLTNYS